MAAGRTAGVDIGLDDLSNKRALRETYGIQTIVTAIGPDGVTAATDVLGDLLGAGDILNVLGTARVADVVDGNDRVTVTAVDNQPLEGAPRRLVWTYTDAALADAVGTIRFVGFNSFGDPITETVNFLAGTLTGTTARFFSRVSSVVVQGATALIDIAADLLMVELSQHVAIGPLDPGIVVAGATRLDLLIPSVQQHVAAGDRVQQTFSPANAAPVANTWQLAAINADGEGSLLFNALDDWGAIFYFVIQHRYRLGQAL